MNKRGILKSDLCISVEKCGLKIIFFKFKNNTVDIIDEYFLENRLETRVFLEQGSGSEYIKTIVESIKNRSIKNNISGYSRVYINIQESDIMLRNVYIDSEIKENMLVKAIELELNEYIPNIGKDYIIKYRYIEKENEFIRAGTVIFPKKYKELYGKLCDEIKCEKRYISINFDILGKIIHSFEIFNNKFDDNVNKIYIECRKEDVIITKAESKRIIESYVINNEDLNEATLTQVMDGIKESFIYGIYNPYIVGEISNVSTLNDINLASEISINKRNEKISSSDYINLIGFLM